VRTGIWNAHEATIVGETGGDIALPGARPTTYSRGKARPYRLVSDREAGKNETISGVVSVVVFGLEKRVKRVS